MTLNWGDLLVLTFLIANSLCQIRVSVHETGVREVMNAEKFVIFISTI